MQWFAKNLYKIISLTSLISAHLLTRRIQYAKRGESIGINVREGLHATLYPAILTKSIRETFIFHFSVPRISTWIARAIASAANRRWTARSTGRNGWEESPGIWNWVAVEEVACIVSLREDKGSVEEKGEQNGQHTELARL